MRASRECLCETPKWPVPNREPGETDDTFLARRVQHLKVYSPQWATVDLTKLSHDELELAASQICNAAADNSQSYVAERVARKKLASMGSKD